MCERVISEVPPLEAGVARGAVQYVRLRQRQGLHAVVVRRLQQPTIAGFPTTCQ